jgi:DNA-binding helix-hairpin-helix protein with protein kinase domain
MDESSQIPHEVVDAVGYLHRLGAKPIGQGGQGIVFRTRDQHMAVKLLTEGLGQPLQTPEGRARLARQLENLRLLPLPELHIATPLSMLAPPFVGYVMRLLTDMVPIRTLLASSDSKLAEFYLAGGGLKRRVGLLARTAEIFARLHAVPVVYADISPNNVFISKDSAAGEVWLIDSDNLHFLSRSSFSLYTPGFGAPEIVQNKSGVNTLTDIHAFAVLAFHVLCQQHPFLGDFVENGGGWDADQDHQDLEAKAFAGEIPWIHDENDNTNQTDNGIPRDIVLSPRLWELFHATFGAGRTQPSRRPSMLQWVEALYQAADLAVTCPDCQSSYYINAKTCPWCGAPMPPIVYLESRCWVPELDETEESETEEAGAPWKRFLAARPEWRKVLVVGPDATIGRNVVEPTLFRDGNPVALRVEFSRKSLKLTPVNNQEFHACTPSGELQSFSGPVTIAISDLRAGWHLHCGPIDRPHRLVSFGYFEKRTT